MFALHSRKVLSDILEGVISETFLLTPLVGLIPSFFCMTSAFNILVVQFTILQVFSGEYHYLYLLLYCISENK